MRETNTGYQCGPEVAPDADEAIRLTGEFCQPRIDYVASNITAKAATQAAQVADFVLIPCRPGLLDLAAIAGAVQIASEARVPAAVVFNAAGIRSPLVVQAQGALLDAGVTVAPVVHQRVAHVYAITQGLAAAEHNPGSKAAQEIEALWQWLHRELQRKRRKK